MYEVRARNSEGYYAKVATFPTHKAAVDFSCRHLWDIGVTDFVIVSVGD